LLPGNPEECFTFAQKAFDIAERLQSPTFILTDLDLGMNLWMTPEFTFPTSSFDRGKVLTAEQLDQLVNYERYGDPDGDGVAYRALPGTKNLKAPYLTRGSGHNKSGGYTEKADEYKFIVDRLAKKWELAKSLVPTPVTEIKSEVGIIYYGSSEPAVIEALDQLQSLGKLISKMRIRSIPFGPEVRKFLEKHSRIYVLDLNRDGQMLQLLKLEFTDLATKLYSIRHYDGTPIPAEAVFEPLQAFEVKGGNL
jgi:2-oxoglutarate ferredoxin oxidoreductase subunit alpha